MSPGYNFNKRSSQKTYVSRIIPCPIQETSTLPHCETCKSWLHTVFAFSHVEWDLPTRAEPLGVTWSQNWRQ
jgi:hypothetical protein